MKLGEILLFLVVRYWKKNEPRIKARLLSELKQGMIVEGVVKNLAPYGAFIDLGGIDGLLHVSDLSYNKLLA